MPITIDFFKKYFLTYTSDKVRYEHHTELALDNRDLESFIQKLTININAVSYADQYKKTINSFENLFDCSSFQAEHYFYNNALKVIKDLAIQNMVRIDEYLKENF
ncbi:hypothetical protein M3638_08585 [Oceanobacillus profundus]|uniref:hypothetical protein n=1 Tax=Oceanobacillus profundus TaxID=372463 RepID=UPI002041EC1E|nr:hypothetical protein [Oceanobacillus profundus]MCM3397880.1 hypothetical protein [Oceanobacillus profundus]